jgi:hypothetical protein
MTATDLNMMVILIWFFVFIGGCISAANARARKDRDKEDFWNSVHSVIAHRCK